MSSHFSHPAFRLMRETSSAHRTRLNMFDQDSDSTESSLLDAIVGNHVSDVKRFLDSGLDCNKPLYNEETGQMIQPISLACSRGSVDVVRYLIRMDVDLGIPGTDGKLPIHCTCDADERFVDNEAASVEALGCLIEAKADVNAVDNMGRTPLFLACEADYADAVRMLIEANCDTSFQTVCGDSPLKVSCRNAKYWSYLHGRENSYGKRVDRFNFPPILITKMLLKANADVAEATLLPTAIQFGDVTLLKELLDMGMDVNMLDDNMCTPLGAACSSVYVSANLVQLLLDRGADVNKGGGWKKQKPIIFAYVHNSVDKIRLLLSYGARLTPQEMTELVSLTLSKTILENPEVIGPGSKELFSWRLLMAHGFSPVVTGTELYYKVHQLSMCSSYDKISPWIQSLLFPMRSLKECCRTCIRNSVRPTIDSNINQLPLPDSIKGFLKLNDFSTEDEK